MCLQRQRKRRQDSVFQTGMMRKGVVTHTQKISLILPNRKYIRSSSLLSSNIHPPDQRSIPPIKYNRHVIITQIKI